MIDVKGIPKAELLAGLYNRSKPQGLGFLDYKAEKMSIEEAEAIIEEEGYSYDYLIGRVIKINIGRDEIDPSLYDRDNGKGAAQSVVDELKSKYNIQSIDSRR